MELGFDAAVDHLDRTDTVVIATPLRAGGERETPIWSVVVDGVPYIRSANGVDAHWYRRAVHAGGVAFIDDDDQYRVSLAKLDDESLEAKIDEAYRLKYAGDEASVKIILDAPARVSTLRVDPRN